jgi:hypothetical protein
MLWLNGSSARVCGGFTRRDILQIGALGSLGLTLPAVLRARETASKGPLPQRADACILVYLFGGPSHIDTFDMKPAAPSDFRGEFRPIATNVSGISICEHFPALAQQTDQYAIVRSMNHLHPRHGYGLYYMFTGRPHARPDLDAPPTPDDFPTVGSIVAKVRGPRTAFPPAVTLPRWNRFLDVPNDYAGETAGFLGRTYDPWLITAEPGSAEFEVAGVDLPEHVSLARLGERRGLLQRLDRQMARIGENAQARQYDSLYRQAFALVASPKARAAFRLDDESDALRDRYGRHPFGQGLLLARRLVEAGTCLVTVNWHNDKSDVKSPFWDTHKDNFSTLRDRLIPPVDQGLSALLADLASRGLLERTLVVVMGEFGRTPKIGRVVMNAATNASGRDHWPHAYSALLAGGGVRGGQVYGASDDRAAYVTDDPVSPPDLTATILWAMGMDTAETITDRLGRPHRLAEGEPVVGIF